MLNKGRLFAIFLIFLNPMKLAQFCQQILSQSLQGILVCVTPPSSQPTCVPSVACAPLRGHLMPLMCTDHYHLSQAVAPTTTTHSTVWFGFEYHCVPDAVVKVPSLMGPLMKQDIWARWCWDPPLPQKYSLLGLVNPPAPYPASTLSPGQSSSGI